ncbi:hypothetical protein B0O80DRAFT_428722 [Mortierella sp. GBAus27b]|nr:hypothetical protein B0O80DRAFT_428722 [Mortierella sp. GBAus27b]
MINSKDAGARSQESENGQADVAAKGDRFGQESLDADRELSSLRLRKIFTLIFIHDKEHGQLLLGQKQRGALLGQWNGFGGKVEPGIETVAESAARELKEEAFLTAPLFPIGFIQWVVSSPGEVTYRDVMVVYKAHSCNLADPSTTSSQNAPATPISGSSSTPYPTDMDQSQKAPERITEFKASDEMAPAWWDIDMLPWKAMRVNHRVWYPFMLADRPYKGVYWYQMTRAVAAEARNSSRDMGRRRGEEAF